MEHLLLMKNLKKNWEIMTDVLDIIRDEFYPPEKNIRKAFIKKVEEAESRVKEGKFSRYSAEEFEKRFV